MSLPLISIVIPMYNERPEFLRESLQSAINQTYSNIEIIVSDNHSTNDAASVLKEFSDKRLRVIKPFQHLNIVDHFNFVAAAATGEYLSILTSDDFLYPKCIATVVQPLIENKDLCYAYCESAIIDGSGKRQYILRKLQMPSGIYQRNKIATLTYNNQGYWIIGAVIRHEHFKKIGFAKEMRAADWVLSLQLLKYGEVAYFNEILSAIRLHEREGDAKYVYAEAYTLNDIQRPERHRLIIDDPELLKAIGLSKKQAISYRNKEILGSVIVLVRQYHKRIVNRDTVNKIFGVYKQSQSGFSFNFLTRFYATRPALYYTYVLGLYRKLHKKISFA